MRKGLVSLSKYLSYLLRHGAEQEGLTLDERGFASFEKVWALVETRYPNCYTEADLEKILEGDRRGKKRLEKVGDQIRAMYGHNRSLQQTVQYEQSEPPALLYHGTTPEAYDKILEDGLRPMQRQYVHLAIDSQLAQRVASRYTNKPIMLKIHAKDAFDAGHIFYHPEESHYLSVFVPAEFISRLIPEE